MVIWWTLGRKAAQIAAGTVSISATTSPPWLGFPGVPPVGGPLALLGCAPVEEIRGRIGFCGSIRDQGSKRNPFCLGKFFISWGISPLGEGLKTR